MKHTFIECFDQERRSLIESQSEHADNLGGLSFEDSKKAVQLQAADLISFQERRYAKKAKGDKSQPVNQVYRRILWKFKSKEDFYLFDAVRLQPVHERFEDLLRTEELRRATGGIESEQV